MSELISEDLERKFGEAWFASIPPAYRKGTSVKFGEAGCRGAIVLPAPASAMLEFWLGMIEPHLTQNQKNASLARSGAKHKNKGTRVPAKA